MNKNLFLSSLRNISYYITFIQFLCCRTKKWELVVVQFLCCRTKKCPFFSFVSGNMGLELELELEPDPEPK